MAGDEQIDAKPDGERGAETKPTRAGRSPAPLSQAARSASVGTAGARRRVRATEGQVGQTLRTVYQQAVNEDVPADLLDLLGKLA